MNFVKTCTTCGNSFQASGPAARYCGDCRVPSKTRAWRNQYMRERRKAAGSEVGVGKGNHSRNRGPSHPQYKNGWTAYIKLRSELKAATQRCNRCEKDLSNATRWEWVCHHKDHDRSNADRDNLEILCKRCHQVEHQCWKAFEGATTIPSGSRAKRPEAPDTPSG